MKKRRYRRLFAVLTAAMFSACNVSTALAMPLQELTEDYQDFNTKLVEESRPKDIGSDAFSEWFFTYLEEETLWDWFYGVMEDDTNEDYSALYSWYEKNQEQIAKQLGTNAPALMASSVGDLWNNWIDGNFDLTGDGTESNPYQIEDLEDLMIMTQAIAAGTGNYDTAHYRLMDDIDLSFTINNGNWNPIGWYQNAAQLSGNVSNSFKGTFDGDGHTISGLKIVNISKPNKYRGFFVLGPISTCSSRKANDSINYIPLHCIDYCAQILLSIATDKFNKTMSTKSFNPHIKKAIEYVHKHYDKSINITDLCEHLNLNKSYFCSTFKTTTGHTFCHFLNHFRIEKSKKLLLETDLNMLDIALSVGFNNQNYYCTMFKKFTGKTPLQYKVCNKHS